MLYDTSPLRKIITKIRVSWRNDDAYIAKAGLYRLDPNDGNRILEVLYFGGFHTENPGVDGAIIRFDDATDGRIVIPAGIRLGIALSRNDNHAHSLDIQHGFENANSPDESYSDASVDFDFIGNTRLASVEPDTDDSLSPHNNEVWGNIKIFYTVAVSHASLIGDDNVSVDHITSGSAADGQVMKADGSSGTAWEDEAGGPDATGATDGHVWTADGADGADWEALPADTGVTDFVGLSDTPAALGTAGQVPAVNAAGDALEFTDVEGVTGSSEEFLFDNHPDLVQIGTLNTVINLTTTSIVLAATPDPVPTAAGFLLIDSEVMDITAVNGSTLTVTRAARGTTATAHVAGVEVLYLTVANGGLGRTFLTRTWVHGATHENRVDLGRALTSDDDDAEIYVEFEYDSGGARRIGEAVIDAHTLREMHDLDRIASSTTNETFPIVMQRPDQNDLTNNAVMLVHVGRRRFTSFDAANYGVVAGNDGLIIGVGSGNATVATLFRVYIRVTLVHATGGAAETQSGGIALNHRVAVRDAQTLAAHLTSDAWENSTFEFITFAPVATGDLLHIDFTVRIGGEVEQTHRISRSDILRIGFQNTTGYSPYLTASNFVINSAIVPTYMVMGNQGAGQLREDLILPTMGRVEAHRASGRGMVMFFFVEDADGNLSQINVSTRSNLVTMLTRLDVVVEVAA